MSTSDLAHLSDSLFTLAIAVYSVALVSFCGEYAFGRKGRVGQTVSARSSATTTPAVERAMAEVGAPRGGSTSTGTRADDAEPREPRSADPSAEHARRTNGALASTFGRAGITICILGALLHAVSISLRGAAVDRVPWGNMYEFASVVGLVGVLSFLAVLIRQPRLRYLGVFVLFPVLVVMFLAGTVLYARANQLVPALHSYWLAIHVSAAATGTGILMVSAVATGLYLIRTRFDRLQAAGRQDIPFPVSLGRRLPLPDSLDRMAYRTAAFAFPIYTFGIICGAIWAEAAWGRYWGWDPKETWAFISWVVYAAYLHARATAGWRGKKAAWINVFGFASMIFNFFVVNIVVSGLHSYAGLN
ncbi:MAG: c-type cytochrome biogenesis protein CcsB [Mycobacteriales bacterium]